MDAGTHPTPKGSAGLMVGPAFTKPTRLLTNASCKATAVSPGGFTTQYDPVSVPGFPEQQYMHTHACSSNPIHRVTPYAAKAREKMPKCISRLPGTCPPKGGTLASTVKPVMAELLVPLACVWSATWTSQPLSYT